jgi:hypothetical protein
MKTSVEERAIMATYAKTRLVSFSALAVAVTVAGFTGAAYAQSDEEYVGAAHHSLINNYDKSPGQPAPPNVGGSHQSPGVRVDAAGSNNLPATAAVPAERATGSILDNQPCYVDIPAYDKSGKFLGRGMINTCY